MQGERDRGVGMYEGKGSFTTWDQGSPSSAPAAAPWPAFLGADPGSPLAPLAPEVYLCIGSRAVCFSRVSLPGGNTVMFPPFTPWLPDTLLGVALSCPAPVTGQGQCSVALP